MPKKKRKLTKKVKATVKRIDGISDNQLDNLKQWLSFYSKNNKLPYSRIICSYCKVDFVNLKGIGMSHAMKAFDNNIKKVLTESVCKSCKEILNPPELKEKKEKVVEYISREEMEARREAIRATLPKFNPDREPAIYDLAKNKDKCKEYTYFSCHRPDIYLDYGCEQCVLNKNCMCPIKDVTRIADGRHKKKKK
jgi:hypothetical protein